MPPEDHLQRHRVRVLRENLGSSGTSEEYRRTSVRGDCGVWVRPGVDER